ncbi:integral membrane protein [Purpureocillium lavendulum]|uniref:Integral membrane protein n=1 Tax=Purpureocillium lavendulum TaxID=1247861 RepID=A0AB34FX10_9HYPO|nr:integral membrane protein [Purpureocillium lavendulum]
MGVGRFFCVALPLILTIGAIVSLLVATLSGVVHNNLYVFQVNVTDLSINPANFDNIANKLGGRADNAQTSNITAGNLGLDQVYDINLWGYCSTNKDGKRDCIKARFDWASHELNTTWIEDFGAAAGAKIQLPKEVKDALKVFRTVTKWTEVAFIIALVALGVELVVGIFANCSRIASCLTWLVASLAAVLVGASAGLATAMATIVVGTVEGTGKFYGVEGKIGGQFLAAVWIATAFAIGAAFFWLFTICCCKPEHRKRSAHRASKHDDGEKLLPTRGYSPLTSDHEMSSGYYNPNQQQNQQFAHNFSSQPRYPSGNGRSDLAYEPYSHRA